jgi:hypothetical protein
MPKVSTSSREKKRSKDRASGRQYHDAAILIRKLRKSRFKGIVEVIEPVKPRQFERTPNLKVDMDWFGRKMEANSEENRPYSVPIIQGEVYAANLNKPRVIISATAK